MTKYSDNEIKIIKTESNLAAFYICPICIINPSEEKSDFIHMAATASLVNTGEKDLLITNHHVTKEFLRLKDQKNDVLLRIESFFWDLKEYEENLIDSNEALDLAIFKIDSEKFLQYKKQCCLVYEWPPKRPIVEESILMIGFPGKLRHRISRNKVQFEVVPIIELVTTVTEKHFSIQLDRENWAKISGWRDPSEFTDLGGYSGSAVFRLKMRKGIMILEPIGIIYESGETTDIHLIRHIDFINSDGTIRKPIII